MPQEKSIACHTDMSAVSFSNSAFEDHESLGADQEQAPETQESIYDDATSRGGPFIMRFIYSEIPGLV
jgi:hypothetical protein